MKLHTSMLAVLFTVMASAVGAGEMPEDVAAALDRAGVPVYPGAVYCIGDTEVGIRLATSDDPDKVKAWYAAHIPAWTGKDVFGMWVLIDAPADANISGADLMSRNNLVVDVNGNLPEWYGLDADMTTQVVVMLPGDR